MNEGLSWLGGVVVVVVVTVGVLVVLLAVAWFTWGRKQYKRENEHWYRRR